MIVYCLHKSLLCTGFDELTSSKGVSSSANSSLEWVSQKAASSSMVLKVGKVPERLRDIQDAITRIMKYTREGRDRYDHDELVQTWVTHNLYVIGEAARAIASDFPDFKDQHPEIKWTEIIGMRTVLAHRYFDTDPDAL